jgi:hypothetical protein
MQSQFEPYLKEVENRLRTLSKEEKAREITEIRSHLEAASEDYCEQGMSEERATMLSLEEFGAPQSVARQLIKIIWRARLKNMPHTFLGTTLFCLPIPFLVNLSSNFLMSFIRDYYLPHGKSISSIMSIIYVNISIFIPLIILLGYLAGVMLPKHAWRSCIISHANFFLIISLGYVAAYNAKVAKDGVFHDAFIDVARSVGVFTLFVLLWLMLPLKRYARALLGLIPIVLCYLCFLYCNQTPNIRKLNIEDTNDPMKSFSWTLVNPFILFCSLAVAIFIITFTSLGVGLGRLHARCIQRRKVRAV